MYRNVKKPEEKASFRTWQYSGGHWNDCHRNTSQTCISLNRTVSPLNVPPLCALCSVKIYGLNQLYCSAETFLDAALSCLFKEHISPPPLCFCTAFIFDVTGCWPTAVTCLRMSHRQHSKTKTYSMQWPHGCQGTITSVLHPQPQACQRDTAIYIFMIITPKLLIKMKFDPVEFWTWVCATNHTWVNARF